MWPEPASEAPLFLLMPVTLGATSQVPTDYLNQIPKVFTFPQSLGIVGGRVGASLYFVGVQEAKLLYLDPHTVHNALDDTGDLSTFTCDRINHMNLASINPSLAMGFFCRDRASFEDLCFRLGIFERKHRTRAIAMVRDGFPPSYMDEDACSVGSESSWELL